jgi:hypothetical protein
MAICDFFKSLILWIINLIPPFPDFSGLISGLDSFLDVAAKCNLVVSMPLVGTCLLIILAVYNIDFVFSFLMWIVRKIPGMS